MVGTASTEAGLETAKIAGADFVFNHRYASVIDQFILNYSMLLLNTVMI